jgi:hypothetical protein
MFEQVFSPDKSGKPFVGLEQFFSAKKATERSSFFGLEKRFKTKKLVTDNRNQFCTKLI